MSNTKFTTFAVTVRPRDGITLSQISKFTDFVKKHCLYYLVVTEKTGDEKHIHAALFFKISKTRSNVSTYLSRLFSDLDEAERKVLLKGVKILYSTSWIAEYLNKDDDTVVVERNLPELSTLESFYPPKPVATSSSAARRLNMHSVMEQYESLWRQYVSPLVSVNTSTVRDFLFDMQYNQRVIGLMDDKKLIQHSRWFTRWYHRAESCPGSFLPPFETEEGPGIHDTRSTCM